MVFNIGSQNAGLINNVAGDQVVNGDQHGSATIDGEAGRALLARLRREVSAADLPSNLGAVVERELDACDGELRRPDPKPQALGDRLAKMAQILVSVGAVVSAGTGLGAALAALAGWLGQMGEPIRRALSNR